MKKIILLLAVILVGLSARADYTVTTTQPVYQAPIQQPINYSALQPYAQPYTQTYGQNYGQNYVQPYTQQYNPYSQNPYQTSQCQGNYINPYQYRNQYGYGASPYGVGGSVLSGLGGLGGLGGTSTGGAGIVKNIGQSVLYSMLRGY